MSCTTQNDLQNACTCCRSEVRYNKVLAQSAALLLAGRIVFVSSSSWQQVEGLPAQQGSYSPAIMHWQVESIEILSSTCMGCAIFQLLVENVLHTVHATTVTMQLARVHALHATVCVAAWNLAAQKSK